MASTQQEVEVLENWEDIDSETDVIKIIYY